MISTVNTTAGTVATAASLVSGLGPIVTTTLIALLIAKELAGATLENLTTPEFTLPGVMDRALNVGIIPLSIVFVSIVFVKILNVL